MQVEDEEDDYSQNFMGGGTREYEQKSDNKAMGVGGMRAKRRIQVLKSQVYNDNDSEGKGAGSE